MMGKQTGRLMILIVTVTMLLPVPSGHAGFWKEFALALTGAEIGSGYEEDWDGPAPSPTSTPSCFPVSAQAAIAPKRRLQPKTCATMSKEYAPVATASAGTLLIPSMCFLR
jgi:hypothetical protein